jgi:putative addiction module component (TIGR02574 family)
MTKLDIERLSHHEKLELMSLLWDSLDKSRLELSQAHKDILDERLKEIEEGTAVFSPWSEVKERLRSKLK